MAPERSVGILAIDGGEDVKSHNRRQSPTSQGRVHTVLQSLDGDRVATLSAWPVTGRQASAEALLEQVGLRNLLACKVHIVGRLDVNTARVARSAPHQ
jgi:hypothetical protein